MSPVCSAPRINWGEALGLDNDWAYRIIKQVGNYGEVFERNVGQDFTVETVSRD